MVRSQPSAKRGKCDATRHHVIEPWLVSLAGPVCDLTFVTTVGGSIHATCTILRRSRKNQRTMVLGVRNEENKFKEGTCPTKLRLLFIHSTCWFHVDDAARRNGRLVNAGTHAHRGWYSHRRRLSVAGSVGVRNWLGSALR